MAHPRKLKSKKDDSLYPLDMIVTDAVESASEAADEAGADIHLIINKRAGLGAVFTAAMDAVADTEPGNIGPSVFDAAVRAAEGAVASSTIPSCYDRVRLSVQSIPDRLVRAAGQWAAADLFASMSGQSKSDDGGRLLGRMRVAAVKAAKTRLKQDDAVTVVQAAVADVQEIASAASDDISNMVMIGVPVHAATVAVFEVAIRGVPPDDLVDAIEEACNDLPEMARRHDDLIIALVTALAIVIADDAAYRQKYHTAVRGAKKACQDEAADRIVDEIVGNTFQSVYMALVSSAYANSDGSAFESGYDDVLAVACGIDLDRSRRKMASMMESGNLPGVDEEAYLNLQQNLVSMMGGLLIYELDPPRRKTYMNAMDVDYKKAVSSGQINGIIALYDMAYRAAYKGAGTVVGEKSRGKNTGPQ